MRLNPQRNAHHHITPTFLVPYFRTHGYSQTRLLAHLHPPTGLLFPPVSTSTFLTNPSLVRVGNSRIHPHPPVKVFKPDWGHSTSASSEPNLRATWLGHAVRCSRTRCSSTLTMDAPVCQGFFVEFPRTAAGSDEEPPRVLFDPIFSDGVGPLPWLTIRRHLPPCILEELPEFQLVVYSHNKCVVRLATLNSSKSILYSYDHLDFPALQ